MCKHYDEFLAKFPPDVTVWNKSKIAAIGTLSILGLGYTFVLLWEKYIRLGAYGLIFCFVN